MKTPSSIPQATFYTVAAYAALVCLVSFNLILLSDKTFLEYLLPQFSGCQETQSFIQLWGQSYKDPFYAFIAQFAFGVLPMMLFPILLGQWTSQRILALKLPTLGTGDFHQLLMYGLAGLLVGNLLSAFLYYSIKTDVLHYHLQVSLYSGDVPHDEMYVGMAVSLFCVNSLLAAIWFTGGLLRKFPREALPAWALNRVRRYEKIEHSINRNK